MANVSFAEDMEHLESVSLLGHCLLPTVSDDIEADDDDDTTTTNTVTRDYATIARNSGAAAGNVALSLNLRKRRGMLSHVPLQERSEDSRENHNRKEQLRRYYITKYTNEIVRLFCELAPGGRRFPPRGDKARALNFICRVVAQIRQRWPDFADLQAAANRDLALADFGDASCNVFADANPISVPLGKRSRSPTDDEPASGRQSKRACNSDAQ